MLDIKALSKSRYLQIQLTVVESFLLRIHENWGRAFTALTAEAGASYSC